MTQRIKNSMDFVIWSEIEFGKLVMLFMQWGTLRDFYAFREGLDNFKLCISGVRATGKLTSYGLILGGVGPKKKDFGPS